MKPGETFHQDGKLMVYVRCPNCDEIRTIKKRNGTMFVPVIMCRTCNQARGRWMSGISLNSGSS